MFESRDLLDRDEGPRRKKLRRKSGIVNFWYKHLDF